MSSVLADYHFMRKRRQRLVQLSEQGLSVRHIAQIMTLTEATVERMLANAKKKRQRK